MTALLILLACGVALLALLVTLQALLLALRLFDGAWRGVRPAWLHRLHRRIGVAVHDTVSLRLRLRLLPLCTLAERLVAGLALPARPVLLLAREVTLLALLLALRAQQTLTALLPRLNLLALLTLQSLLLLAVLLGSGTLLGIKRATVWRRTLLGDHGLHGLARAGQCAQAFTLPAAAGVFLRVVLARIVSALITSVITPVLASVVTSVLALAGLLRLAGHHGPHGDGCWRQRGGTGHPWQVAQAGHALRQAPAIGRNHLGAAQIGQVQALALGAHRLAAGEVFGAHRADGVALALVAVVVGDVDVVHHDVLVHIGDVARAVLIGRTKSLSRRQREPAQARLRPLLANRHIPVHTAGVAADEGNQRRRVHRLWRHTPRHPAPARADLRPAAVVEGCKAPGRVVHPGPAPGRYPAPVACSVGCPVHGHGARQPHGAIGRVLIPVAVVVELLVADHFARNVAGRYRLVFQTVALMRPGIEAVLHCRPRAGRGQLRVGEIGLLARSNIDRRAAVAVNRAGTLLHHDAGGAGTQVARGACVDAVVAGLGDHKRQVGRVDLDPLAFKQLAHAQLHRALRQAQLGGVVVEFQEIEAGLLTQAHGSRSDVQL